LASTFEGKMKIELIFYRLAVLVSLVSGVGGAGMSAYSYHQSGKWQEAVSFSFDVMNQGYADCENDVNSLSCGWIQDRRQAFDRSVEKRDRYSEAVVFWLRISLVVPFLALFSFYSFRWVYSGRILPLLIGRKNE
jgi:hypothetical protein